MSHYMQINNINLSYGDKVVLRDVKAEIRPSSEAGQIVGFVGPSGIGKSSLIRIIAGLNKPTSGTVTIDTDNNGITAGEIGVVAQNYPLFDHRTIESNLMIAGSQLQKNKQILKNMIADYAKDFGLESLLHSYPAQLSGGQRQRAAILQQVLCCHGFLLLDEPFSGLDIIMEGKVIETILKLTKYLSGIIVASHDISAIVSLCDRAWMLGRDQGQPGAYIKYDIDFTSIPKDPTKGRDTLQPEVSTLVTRLKQQFYSL